MRTPHSRYRGSPRLQRCDRCAFLARAIHPPTHRRRKVHPADMGARALSSLVAPVLRCLRVLLERADTRQARSSHPRRDGWRRPHHRHRGNQAHTRPPRRCIALDHAIRIWDPLDARDRREAPATARRQVGRDESHQNLIAATGWCSPRRPQVPTR